MDAREFLYKRKNRLVGQLLGKLEREIWPSLSPQQRDFVTNTVKDSVGSYHADALMVAEDTPDTEYNPIAMKVKDRMHDGSHQQG